MKEKKVSLFKSIMFTICSVIVLDTFVASSLIGVSAITIWLVAAIVFFMPYGLISAELGSAYPHDGGIYHWVDRAFGEGCAVIVGFHYWISVAFWMPAVFIAFSSWISYVFFPSADPWVLAGIATAMCWITVFVGIRGVELSVTVTDIAAVAKVAVLLIFGGLGIVYAIRNGLANDFSLEAFIPSFDNTTQYIAAITYNLLGFELIGSIGSQIHDPGKTIPRMTIFAGVAITALYIFGTFGVLAAIPAGEIDAADGFFFALQELCSVFGSAQRPIFVVLVVVGALTLVANMVSWSMGSSQVLSAARLDTRSRILGHRNKKYGTSDGLYIIMGIIATLLLVINFALAGDAKTAFWTILSFSFVIFLIPYLFMFPAAVRLRKIDPDTPRPYKIPGGMVGISICATLCELVVLVSLVFLFKDAGGGLPLWTLIIGTLCTGAVGYWIYKSGPKGA